MNLKCPYCDEAVEIEEGLLLNGDPTLKIVCSNYTRCGASWGRYGDLDRCSKTYWSEGVKR